jgi:hypothetical protein
MGHHCAVYFVEEASRANVHVGGFQSAARARTPASVLFDVDFVEATHGDLDASGRAEVGVGGVTTAFDSKWNFFCP